jgi:hypothetical protein
MYQRTNLAGKDFAKRAIDGAIFDKYLQNMKHDENS